MTEFTEADRDRIDETYKHVQTMNREMGEIAGELKWIRWIIIGTFLAACIDMIIGLWPGG